MEFFKKNNKNDILNFILNVFIETNKNVIQQKLIQYPESQKYYNIPHEED